MVCGGSKDTAFNRELSDLIGTKRIHRRNHQHGKNSSFSTHGEDVPVIRPEHLRELPGRSAMVIAENGKPIVAKLLRCIDGRSGRKLLAEQAAARRRIFQPSHRAGGSIEQRTKSALGHSHSLGLIDEEGSY